MLIILASAQEDSINGKILDRLLVDIEASVLRLNKYQDIPILISGDRVPKKIKEIDAEIKKHSKLVIFSPEHNGYFSAFFKNIIDWLSIEDKEFLNGKQVILVSVSKTEKIKRVMEDGVRNTLNKLGASSIKFINFNKYSEENIDIEKIKALHKAILD